MDKPDTGAAGMLARGQAPKGIVDPLGAAQRIRLATYPPCPALSAFVDYFWLVQWDLGGGAPQTQRVLPYPNAHLVFERGQTALHGVVRGPFERTVAGAGQVLGVRFKPGGLRPFTGQPMARLTGRIVAPDAMLGISGEAAERLVFDTAPDQSGDAAKVAAASALLRAQLPAPDPRARLAAKVVGIAQAAQGPVSVAALCALAGIGERALQRLFSDYVGVSPKWVIQRARLQEATWLLSQASQPDGAPGGEPGGQRGGQPDLSGLALRLGFFDQAHLTRDFTLLVGTSPLAYWKSQQR